MGTVLASPGPLKARDPPEATTFATVKENEALKNGGDDAMTSRTSMSRMAVSDPEPMNDDMQIAIARSLGLQTVTRKVTN